MFIVIKAVELYQHDSQQQMIKPEEFDTTTVDSIEQRRRDIHGIR